MGIRVLKAGMLTTVQDLGRTGYRKEGIIVSGAMDQLALQIGNLLLGNEADTAGLECTLLGPALLFETTQLVAITGGNLQPLVNGNPVNMWRPLLLHAGSILSFEAASTGCRAYLTVYGGFDLPLVLGSHATYLKAGFGGYNGSALTTDNVLHFKQPYRDVGMTFKWSPDPRLYIDFNDDEISVLKGPEFDLFKAASKRDVLNEPFVISKAADRMGYRLEGVPLLLDQPKEMLSAAVSFGTIQVTSNGGAILLMADHQTTGGYPRILQVVTADLPKLAQMQTARLIRFKLVTLEAAQEALRARARELRQLKQAINFKYNDV